MEFRFPPEQEAFRAEIRAFIGEHLPPDWPERSHGAVGIPEGGEESRAFQQAMAARGWLTLAWPKAYGGRDASVWDQVVMNEEMAYHEAPSTNMSVQWIGPTLMLYGSDAQKSTFLPRIAAAAMEWCTLYSEPGHGSDLAGLETRATRDGDDYVINGQKIWNGNAHRADYGWLAARTDRDAPKHKGITLFVVNMKTPGISVRPLLNLAGEHSFNEVFFEDARIPQDAVVGEVNRGWYQIAVALDFERSGIGRFATGQRRVEELVAFLRDAPDMLRHHRALRYELADRAVEVQVGRYLSYRIAHLQAAGLHANYEASVSKLFGADLHQRIAHTAIRVLGPYGALTGGPQSLLWGKLSRDYLGSVAATIAGGTNEVQRNIIATRGLGLPR